MNFFRYGFLSIWLIGLLTLGTSVPNKVWASEKWNDSRQFEKYLEKAIPDTMQHIWATHVSEEGLEVQVSIFFPIRLIERDNIYDAVSEQWKNSEFVKSKKYSGKVQFLQLDKPLKTIP